MSPKPSKSLIREQIRPYLYPGIGFLIKSAILAENLLIMKDFKFVDKELLCMQTFDQNGPYWHIATPGISTEILFTNKDEYKFGMSLVAESACIAGIRVFSFSVMSNHFHVLCEAKRKEQCTKFLEHLATRLKRFAALKGRVLDLKDFVCEPVPVLTLKALRNNIAYIDRNGYVVNPEQTPYSYPWGTGFLYFGYDPALIPSVPFSSLTIREKKAILHTKALSLPDSLTVRNGHIAPESFVDWRTGRAFFRDAHQYFNLLSKNREAYAEFAALFGDSVVLTDEEMFSAAFSVATNDYSISRLSELSQEQKKALARKMHFDYRAGNAQIARILKLDKTLLQEMFPEAK